MYQMKPHRMDMGYLYSSFMSEPTVKMEGFLKIHGSGVKYNAKQSLGSML